MRTLLINLLMHSMHRAGGCSALKVFSVSLLVYGRVGTKPHVSLQGLGPPFWFFYMCFCPCVMNSCSFVDHVYISQIKPIYAIIKLEKLVNHLPAARDLQAFLVFSQHPAWVITPVNPQKVWSTAFIK